jgi:hypothetical protein
MVMVPEMPSMLIIVIVVSFILKTRTFYCITWTEKILGIAIRSKVSVTTV